MIDIEQVDHIGIRVKDLDRALDFYKILGFEETARAGNDPVVVIKNARQVELNLIYNSTTENDGDNILMDVGEKYSGFTHVALRISSVLGTLKSLEENKIRITQGPVSFGRDGHVSIFVRDPDRNVLELRGRAENYDEIPGLTIYENEN